MPHINTAHGDHDLTVGALIFRKTNNQYKVYLHKHKKYKKYIHFGGHVEKSESIWSAACREVKEESGFDISQLKVWQPNGYTGIHGENNAVLNPLPALVDTHTIFSDFSHFHSDVVYAFLVDSDPIASPIDGESQEIELLSIPEFKKLVEDEMSYRFMLSASEYVINHVAENWELLAADSFSLKSSLML